MREYCTNPQVSQQLQICIEYLRGVNRGEGLGFFLLISGFEGHRSIKLTAQLVKSSVLVWFFGSLSMFAKHGDVLDSI